MRKINEENQTKQDKKSGPQHSDVVAPEDEESIRNKESDDHQNQPKEHFRAPPTVRESVNDPAVDVADPPVLYSRTLVPSVLDANESCS